MKREEFIEAIERGQMVLGKCRYYKSEGRYWVAEYEGDGLCGFDDIWDLWRATSDEEVVVETLGLRAARLFGGIREHERGTVCKTGGRGSVQVLCCKHCGKSYCVTQKNMNEWIVPDGECVLREMDVDDWNVAHRLWRDVSSGRSGAWMSAAKKAYKVRSGGAEGGVHWLLWLTGDEVTARDYCKIECDAKEMI